MAKYLILLLALAGCDAGSVSQRMQQNEDNNNKATQEAFDNPVYVATTQDGKPVLRVEFKPCHNCFSHSVYYVGDAATVNTRAGKSNAVYVLLNGERMTLLQAQIEIEKQQRKAKADQLQVLRGEQ